jgi:hypothetical protein
VKQSVENGIFLRQAQDTALRLLRAQGSMKGYCVFILPTNDSTL